MKKALIILGFLSLFIQGIGIAQSEDHPHGIAARAVFPNYQWPLKATNSLEIVDFSSGLEFEYYRYLNEQLNLSCPLRLSNSHLPINENGETYKAGSLGLDILLNYKIIKEGWFRPHAFVGGGVFVEDLKDFSINIPVGVGLNFQLGRNSFLSTTAVYKVGFKDFRNYLQIGAGLRFNIAPKDKKKQLLAEEDAEKDTDMDGIIDSEDLCPELAGLQKLNGCPDSDNDGVIDSSDHCPNIAGSPILNGCPDNDNDGLIDKEDDCPEMAGPVSNHGCPYGVTKEEIAITAISSPAPIEPAESVNISPKITTVPIIQEEQFEEQRQKEPIINTYQEEVFEEQQQAVIESSPNQESPLDTDGDGTPDRDDKCPNIKGSIQTFGCPELTKTDKEIIAEAIEIVEFETGSAIITTESYPILSQVSKVLLRNSAYQLKLSGHTDSIGSESANELLSKRRALACYNYLLTNGIARSRMSYAGFGESQPIEDNDSILGRERNRRVVFEVFIQ